MPGVVKRFFTEAVAGGEEGLLLLIPDGEGEHAVELFDAGGSPMCEGGRDHFGIAVGSKGVSRFNQCFAEFEVVVDLTIVNDGVSVLVV